LFLLRKSDRRSCKKQEETSSEQCPEYFHSTSIDFAAGSQSSASAALWCQV
jgi:hypothetical protein